MALPTNAINVTNAANFIPEIWSKAIIDPAKANLVLAAKVWRLDSEVKDGGDTVHIPNLTALTAHAKSANAAVNLAGNDTTENVTNLLMNNYYECSFSVENIVKVQSSYDLMKAYTDEASYAITKQMDTCIATLAASVSQNVGTYASTTIADADILRAIQYLDDADAPQSDRYFAFKPEIKAAIMKLDKFTIASAVGRMTQASPVITGQFGEVYGIPASISTNVYKTGTSTSNILFHKKWLAFAVQQNLKIDSQWLLELHATLVSAWAIWGAKETRATFACEIRS